MARTPVLLAWSGGKDAAWTLHTLRQQDEFEILGLLTTITREFDRVSMQGIRRSVLHAQAQAAGLPLIEAMIPAQCINDEYEASMRDALARAAARWPDLRTVAFGDLFLEDIRAYRVANLGRIDWQAITPLFGSDTRTLARDMLAGGLRAELCCVDTQQLDAGFAGRSFDETLLANLPAGVDVCGENGEFHTCVHAGPMFMTALELKRGNTVLRDQRFAYTDFEMIPA